MHLVFRDCDEVKRKVLEIMGGVRYRVQLEIEIDLENHPRSKHSHHIVSMALIIS